MMMIHNKNVNYIQTPVIRMTLWIIRMMTIDENSNYPKADYPNKDIITQMITIHKNLNYPNAGYPYHLLSE